MDTIEDLMAQLIKLRYQYLHPPVETHTINNLEEKVLKSKSEIQKEKFAEVLAFIQTQYKSREKSLQV